MKKPCESSVKIILTNEEPFISICIGKLKNMNTLLPFLCLTNVAICAPQSAAQPIAVASKAPDSVLKMMPIDGKSKRYIQLNYNVSGGKVWLHEFTTGSESAPNAFIDILSMGGKRLQRFQLQLPETAFNGVAYTIRPMWLVPSRKKLPMILFEGTEFHLAIVFPKGFSAAGSQQLLSERSENGRRMMTFDELDRRGYRMVRADTNEPGTEDRPAFKETAYFYWDGMQFSQKQK